MKELYTSTNIITYKPFSSEYFEIINKFSRNICRNDVARQKPELISMAFWARKLNRLEFQNYNRDTVTKPRGTTLHICPSNVPTMVFYSWVYSFITGNSNIIKIPSKHFDEVDIIINEFINLSIPNTKFVSCSHDELASLSKESDTRMIWGGDKTVRSIRLLESKPDCKDLCFSDKLSYLAIDALNYIRLNNVARNELCEKFVTDIFTFGQKGCSSPKKILWVDREFVYEQARFDFYSRVEKIAQDRKLISLSDKVQKDLFVFEDAMNDKENYLCENYGSALTVLRDDDNREMENHCGFGLLYDVRCKSLNDVSLFISKDKTQTISHYGFTKEELVNFIENNDIGSTCRLVEAGNALTFGRYWDGMDLPFELVRYITI